MCVEIGRGEPKMKTINESTNREIYKQRIDKQNKININTSKL